MQLSAKKIPHNFLLKCIVHFYHRHFVNFQVTSLFHIHKTSGFYLQETESFKTWHHHHYWFFFSNSRSFVRIKTIINNLPSVQKYVMSIMEFVLFQLHCLILLDCLIQTSELVIRLVISDNFFLMNINWSTRSFLIFEWKNIRTKFGKPILKLPFLRLHSHKQRITFCES